MFSDKLDLWFLHWTECSKSIKKELSFYVRLSLGQATVVKITLNNTEQGNLNSYSFCSKAY